MNSAQVLAACLVLAGCSAIVPSTAARLAAFDPLTADPSALDVVVVLPPGLSLTPGSATLDLTARRGPEARTGSFRLADQPLTEAVALPQGATARQFALAPADAERMRALQDQIAQWDRQGAAAATFGMGLGGCAIGDGPSPDARGSVLIRVAEDGPLLPLVAEGRLSDLLGPDVLAAIKPCQGAE